MDNESINTAVAMQPYIGQAVSVEFDKVHVHCLIVDLRTVWGKTQYQIQPLAGEGVQWVEAGRIQFNKETI